MAKIIKVKVGRRDGGDVDKIFATLANRCARGRRRSNFRLHSAPITSMTTRTTFSVRTAISDRMSNIS